MGRLSAETDPAVSQANGNGNNGALGDVIVDALQELLKVLFSPIEAVIESHGDAVLQTVVGTPHPDAVFSQPTNAVWPGIYEYYWKVIVPLSLSLFGLAIGIIIFLESTSHLFSGYHRSKLKRRAFAGLLGILSWWWIAALSLRFMDALAGFLVPTEAPGLEVEYFHWTFNMPTDHAEVDLDGVRVSEDAVVGNVDEGLRLAQHFLHENRIRQAAASVGAAQYCIDEAVEYANRRRTWDEPLSTRQGIQFPLAELHTEAEMARNLVRKTAWMLDREDQMDVSDSVSMANYRANSLVCEAADRAMQVHGGMGYSRANPFEHIYRHHRRYRITEGSEEIQKRKIAGHLFGFIG